MEQRYAIRVPRKSKEIHPWHKDDLRWLEETTGTCRSDRLLGISNQVMDD